MIHGLATGITAEPAIAAERLVGWPGVGLSKLWLPAQYPLVIYVCDSCRTSTRLREKDASYGSLPGLSLSVDSCFCLFGCF